jgi:hypothetical protein
MAMVKSRSPSKKLVKSRSGLRIDYEAENGSRLFESSIISSSSKKEDRKRSVIQSISYLININL